MLTRAELNDLRLALATDPERRALLATLERRAAPLLAAGPAIPEVKALLSRDGGVCPQDGASLRFDPWNAERHVCPRCGQAFSGERHHRHWARAQHLWLAERAAELALLGELTRNPAAGARAAELLAGYETRYFEASNRDNVLGPSHLFFSTYLESLWITSFLAAATLMRDAGLLPDARIEGLNRIAEEAAGLIADFNEGLSNRQTWHAAALTAIAVWFQDAELLATSVESRTGLLGHLADGFGADGMWWEGENYHLFALRGLMQGIHWARAMGYDLLDEPEVRSHFRAALLAPARSALPDFTYPARRDARYGVSLAQPASLELWEIGRSWLGDDPELDAWLGALYALPPPPPGEQDDAWLHDAGLPAPTGRARERLSWWALTAMTSLPAPAPPWSPASVLLPDQGLAVLRQGDRYVSLECGRPIGGHGHPDRLHLTVHAGGVHWLPDPGTGSYVQPSLAWYRSALAHNAPILDGANAGGAPAWCAGFAVAPPWGWIRARAGELTRTVVSGPGHLLDQVELDAPESRELLLPWHFRGEPALESPGNWEPAGLTDPFVSGVRRDAGAGSGLRVVTLRPEGSGPPLRVFQLAPGAELLEAAAPGLPAEPGPRRFFVLRGAGTRLGWASVLDFAPSGSGQSVTGLEMEADGLTVGTRAGPIRYQIGAQGVEIVAGSSRVRLAGLRPAPAEPRRLFEPRAEPMVLALAPRVDHPPALDGTLEGFDLGSPLALDAEHQYRRSEEPYDPERFSAEAWINWDPDALYLAARVRKPALMLHRPEAPPRDLDNEPEDVNADGVQIHLRGETGPMAVLVNPQEEGRLYWRAIDGPAPELGGTWIRSPEGYLITLRLAHPVLEGCWAGMRLGFDLLINEMTPERVRRAGQLVWSGGNGWVYLRGDRPDPGAPGLLELG